MTTETIPEKRARLEAEIRHLANKDDITAGEDQRLSRLLDGYEKLTTADADAFEARAARIADAKSRETGRVSGAHTFSHYTKSAPAWATDVRNVTDAAAVDLARFALDDTQAREASIPDAGLAKVTDLLAGKEAGAAARWAVAVSNPDYERAFAKLLGDPIKGHMTWTNDERNAYGIVKDVARALSLGGTGDEMVPFTLDPAIMLSSAGSISPVRRFARNVVTTTSSWNGVTSAGVTASWDAESAQVSDDTPTLAAAPVPVYRGSAFVPFTFEMADAPTLLQELRRLLLDSADQLNATAYTVGAGTTEPTGFVTALDGTASEVAVTTAETFAAGDVYKLIEAVPARFRDNAAWMGNLSIINKIDQFETTNGARLFPSLDDNVLLRRIIAENSAMDGAWNIAATADNFILACGDFNAGMVVVDRIGATLELVPHLMGANGRPTGERGAFLWWRTGSAVVVPNALRLLNIATTA